MLHITRSRPPIVAAIRSNILKWNASKVPGSCDPRIGGIVLLMCSGIQVTAMAPTAARRNNSSLPDGMGHCITRATIEVWS